MSTAAKKGGKAPAKRSAAKPAARAPYTKPRGAVDQIAPATKRKGTVDWQAVERDYRTGKFTNRELGGKYGVSHTAIQNRAKRQGWQQDLSAAVRRATNAKLIAEEVARRNEQEVSDAVSKGFQATVDAVSVAAEMSAKIVIGHRGRLRKLLADADTAAAKLMALTDTVSDVREAATLVGAIESLARTTKAVIDKEREAYGIAEDAKRDEYEDLSDDALQARINELNGRAGA